MLTINQWLNCSADTRNLQLIGQLIYSGLQTNTTTITTLQTDRKGSYEVKLDGLIKEVQPQPLCIGGNILGISELFAN